MSDMEYHHGKRWKEWSLQKKALAICGGILAAAGLIILCGFVFMWLWNGLMPRIFKLPEITYWEGWGLVLLSSILFKGTHGGGNVHERKRKHMIRERMREQEAEEKTE
ncbi:MAG: hypothetical protein NT061_12405 [Spirochaetes bacterium]|nr:hypothetical protein [Spirochaetota bacterium]